ncbi:hypothetical protein B0H21DRAFT_446319 [Amylocystis lapponica]|nr:hypothetical protein B0H21DRAFT_446319 [Amylocystis lapponica]
MDARPELYNGSPVHQTPHRQPFDVLMHDETIFGPPFQTEADPLQIWCRLWQLNTDMTSLLDAASMLPRSEVNNLFMNIERTALASQTHHGDFSVRFPARATPASVTYANALAPSSPARCEWDGCFTPLPSTRTTDLRIHLEGHHFSALGGTYDRQDRKCRERCR